MSLHLQPIDPIPADTARVARAVFRKGDPYMRILELGVFDQRSTGPALVAVRDQPVESPWRLPLALQYAANLSDRQAADRSPAALPRPGPIAAPDRFRQTTPDRHHHAATGTGRESAGRESGIVAE